MTRTRLATFTWAYMLGFAAYCMADGTRRFVAYYVVVGILAGVIRATHKRYPFPPATLWALSVCGLLHMAGGLLPSPDRGAPIFYETWIVQPVLKFDQFVHFTTTAVVTIAVWQLLGYLFKDGAAPLARALLAALVAMGFGGGNEAFEFLSSLRFADAHVGDLSNTGWDLVFNMFGALTAVVWLRVSQAPGSGYNPDMAEKKGKLKEAVGWATGDRRTEAAGRVESKGGDPADDAQIATEHHEVRRDEGDIRTRK